MTAPRNRRAVLGAVLAAGALGATAAMPALAKPTLGEDHPDADLLALGPEIEAADREYELREQARDAAEDVFASIKGEPLQCPEPSERLKTSSVGELIELEKENRWDELRVLAGELRNYEAALEAWRKEKDARRDRERRESGLLAAEEAVSEADSVRLMIRDEKLVPTRARTLDGLIFKARYAASHFRNDYDEDVMTSIVDDLLDLAEEAQA